ncbi:hypothetical protein LIER_27612 [Lithospermum erythrorhizon]|uniref:YqaJ viral recombinase domain-containing protein n=1 Tax=Lithospermum erythrorhizon TaxID=34254 RepID=A0AAV3RGL6_LITER
MTNASICRIRIIHLVGDPRYQRRKFGAHVRIFSSCSMPLSSSTVPFIHCHSPVQFTASLSPADAPQRSEEWFALRKDKLTTSTFSTALGFWKGTRRYDLWHEKVFSQDEQLILSATSRHAMDWGVLNEAVAIERYKKITRYDVSSYGFAIHADSQFGWLGASPDGLLGCYPGGGILEVKCPYNKGKPEMGLPWKTMPYYYMPQVQGQMEIMDRDWVDVYCWTPSGSTVFRVERDRSYWNLMHGILREFWWENVVPAREALLLQGKEEAKSYIPMSTHRQTGLIVFRSRQLAAEAKLLWREIAGCVEYFDHGVVRPDAS